MFNREIETKISPTDEKQGTTQIDLNFEEDDEI